MPLFTQEDGNGSIEEVVVTANRLPSITQLELDRILRYMDGAGGGGSRPTGGGATSPTTDSQENDPLEEIVVTAERLPNLSEEELQQLLEDARYRELLGSLGDGSPVVDSGPTGTTMEDILDALRRYADWQAQQEILRRTPSDLDFSYPAPQPDVPDIFEDTTVDIPADMGYEDIINDNVDVTLPDIVLNPDQDTPIDVDEETGDILIGVPTPPQDGTGEGDGTGDGAGDGAGDGTGDGAGEGAGEGSGTGEGTGQGNDTNDQEDGVGIDIPILDGGTSGGGGTGEGNAGYGNEPEDTAAVIPLPSLLDLIGEDSSEGGGGGGGESSGKKKKEQTLINPYMASISFNPQMLTPLMPKQPRDYLAELIARLQK